VYNRILNLLPVLLLCASVAHAQEENTSSGTTVTTNNTTNTNYTGNTTSNNTNTNTNTNVNTSTNTNNNTNVNTTTYNGTSTNFNNNVNDTTINSTSNNTNTNVNDTTYNATTDNTNRNFNESVSNNTNTNVSTSTSDNTNTNNNYNESVSNSNSTVNSNSTSENFNRNENINRNETVQKIEQDINSPPPSAIAPSIGSSFSQDLCTVGVGGAVQTQIFGFSAGGSVTDENCERIKLSKTMYDMGMKVAAVSLMCQDERVWEAMRMAGTPCPFEGEIGSQAMAGWQDNPHRAPKGVKVAQPEKKIRGKATDYEVWKIDEFCVEYPKEDICTSQ